MKTKPFLVYLFTLSESILFFIEGLFLFRCKFTTAKLRSLDLSIQLGLVFSIVQLTLNCWDSFFFDSSFTALLPRPKCPPQPYESFFNLHQGFSGGLKISIIIYLHFTFGSVAIFVNLLGLRQNAVFRYELPIHLFAFLLRQLFADLCFFFQLRISPSSSS